MSKSISILDKEYVSWVKELTKRYHRSQIKAAVKVNAEQLKYNWLLGRDIVEMRIEERWGESVIKNLATDLQRELPGVQGLSQRNIYYCRNFYLLYSQADTILPQVVAKLEDKRDIAYSSVSGNIGSEDLPQVGANLQQILFAIPWGHHKLLIDKFSNDINKALFYACQTVENGWSRSMLLNFISADLYGRQGKAQTNFSKTLPNEMSDLAQELTKDPYDFAFTGITGRYNERLLKNALLNNITKFLIELGTGFAYVGKEYRLEIGKTENFIDLLFYNLSLSCYVVIEVKIGKFAFADIGQLGGYVVACNHTLRKEGRDNPTIGLLICKEKDRVQAQYALESSSQPIGISEYDLEKFYPEKIEGTMPTIKEIETKLEETNTDR